MRKMREIQKTQPTSGIRGKSGENPGNEENLMKSGIRGAACGQKTENKQYVAKIVLICSANRRDLRNCPIPI
jgi:hypothetical protein